MESPSPPINEIGSPRSAARIVAPIAVFIVSVACYLPAMRNGFVKWDDNGNFLTNIEYQTFTWTSVKWALTTRHMGHYQPVNWLTFIADHALTPIIGPAGPRADDDPYLRKVRPDHWPTHPPSAGRFHQTQAILHGIAAVLVYFLAQRLLQPSSLRPWLCVFAALLFAVHPLRVESVVWASARTDVLATIFMVSATLVYLRGMQGQPATASPRVRNRMIVALLMTLAVFSKVMAITLPAVLLVLDVYFGRVWVKDEDNSATKLVSRMVRLIGQKAELFALAVIGILVARWAHSDSIVDLRVHSISNRFAQFFVSLAFYPYRTIWPFDFSPLYEFPARFGWTHPQVLTSLAGVIVALGLLRKYERNSATWTALAAYLVLIAPVTGLTQRGSQIVADRYSYIACIPLALLAASFAGRLARRHARPTAAAASVALVLLVIQTQRQITYWHDSKKLWERAIELDPTNATAYAAMGAVYDSIGEPDRALRFYQKSVSIRHQQYAAWYAIGNLYRDAGNDEEAIRSYLTELAFNPTHAQTRVQLCLALARLDRLAEAEPHLRQLYNDPSKSEDTLIRHMLADACAERGALDEAIRLLDEGIEIARRKSKQAVVDTLQAARAEYEAARNAPPSPQSRPSSQPESPH